MKERMAADAGARGPLPGRPRRCPEPHRGGRGGSADLPPFSLSAGAEGVCTQRGAGPPTSAGAGGGTARHARSADAERRLSSSRPSGAGGRAGRPSRRLTHSSVPQLMAELEATRAVWLPRCPSALPSVCPTSYWLTGGLAAMLLLYLRRCRHSRAPQ